MGLIYIMSQNLNIDDLFWMNQLQMRWSVTGGSQVARRLLGICSLSVLRLLHETFLVPVFECHRETML